MSSGTDGLIERLAAGAQPVRTPTAVLIGLGAPGSTRS